MPLHDRPTRDDNSYLSNLDDSHGRIGVDSIFSSPSKPISLIKIYLKLQLNLSH